MTGLKNWTETSPVPSPVLGYFLVAETGLKPYIWFSRIYGEYGEIQKVQKMDKGDI